MAGKGRPRGPAAPFPLAPRRRARLAVAAMTRSDPPRPVLIAGPTASGKSELALRIAKRDGGVVINADAAQVYDCWRVLTARPSPEDLARAPHRLYGHVPGATRYSVGDWLRDLAPLLAATDRRPIIIGGTGLYLTALTAGLTEIPPIPAELRARSQALIDAGDLAALRADLAREDPETHGRLDLANPVRVQRAWEVLRATGRGLADWHRAQTRPLLNPDTCVRLVLDPDKNILNNRIEQRFHLMIEQGALAEVADFAALGLDPALPAARVLGAPDLLAHLDGALSLEAAIASAVTQTRQFAKRQRSWFRGRMGGWARIDPLGADPLPTVPLT
ncbi:MAG: tRNA (adenosine(37)-N6)-dimethylallyltransferase MiaA [Rhodovulum sulfidophilum]|uniref:tRNA dimethylallyltransferase n=1 Tax=Rhodovulum sulfidophilum TaxID=35806 RepID=A0A2W5QB20_RHOSU|nr:MAG: tRNA (adenosine(37)-N6)-dimethylallyltransferase MiaA [Rhodovulum sulfidophilum]